MAPDRIIVDMIIRWALTPLAMAAVSDWPALRRSKPKRVLPRTSQ